LETYFIKVEPIFHRIPDLNPPSIESTLSLLGDEIQGFIILNQTVLKYLGLVSADKISDNILNTNQAMDKQYSQIQEHIEGFKTLSLKIKYFESGDSVSYLNKVQRMIEHLHDYSNAASKIDSIYKAVYFIYMNANAPPFDLTPKAFVELMCQFLTYLHKNRTELTKEKDNLQKLKNKSDSQLNTEKKKRAHTFIAMSKQCERRIALLKRFILLLKMHNKSFHIFKKIEKIDS
jgi:hypothetical protein